MMRRTFYIVIGMACATNTPVAAADDARYRLSVVEAGMRDYYCALTVRLENLTETEIDDVNGSFVLFRGDEAIAEGRSASFTGIAPGSAGEATFLAPNEPCDEIDGYAFRVGACRIGGAFENRTECAGWFEADAPIRGIAPR